jgi:hypothetical protein
MSSLNVNPPAVAPPLTVTDEPVFDPTIDAPEVLTAKDQVCPAMFEPVDEYVRPVAPAQTGVGPVIPQLGMGLTVTA